MRPIIPQTIVILPEPKMAAGSARNAQAGTQPAKLRAFSQHQFATVPARDIKGDREAEPRSRQILIARLVQPHEGAEHFLALLCRNAGAIILDAEFGELSCQADRDRDAAAMGGGVL